MAAAVLWAAAPGAVWPDAVPAGAAVMVAPNAYAGDQVHAAHTFFRVDDEMCKGPIWPRTLLTYGLFFDNKRGPVRVAPDRRLFIQANSEGTSGSAFRHCNNIGSFIPEAGHAYEVSQIDAVDSCRLVIVDHASGQEPSSYLAHRVVGPCR